MIHEPEQAETLLQNRLCLDKSTIYKVMEPVFGTGLLTAPGDIILSKNTDVIVSFISMYRNEKYWLNPSKFDPDRFLPERMKDHHSYYFTPFSDGPRNCIGLKYAMISMKTILATLIRTFVFKVKKSIEINEIKLQADITLSTIEPLKIKIEKRDDH